MPLVNGYRLHISSSTFNQIAGHHNEYKITGDLVQPQGENGITILQRSISGDAFYNSEQRFPPPQCHPDTRTAVQDAIQAWAAEGIKRPGPLWRNMARWRELRQSLFPTIAYQLALHIPHLRKPIGLAVEADPAICDKALEEQARAFIVDPMEEHNVADTPYLVIIDGLNECGGKAI
ncbi:hypothetical protein DFH09DRAFT_1327538 [Mycena vulgaris]|nr:hypothetical protein DFH09DRAFT_1327538 [Mycena vulgaris]